MTVTISYPQLQADAVAFRLLHPPLTLTGTPDRALVMNPTRGLTFGSIVRVKHPEGYVIEAHFVGRDGPTQWSTRYPTRLEAACGFAVAQRLAGRSRALWR